MAHDDKTAMVPVITVKKTQESYLVPTAMLWVFFLSMLLELVVAILRRQSACEWLSRLLDQSLYWHEAAIQSELPEMIRSDWGAWWLVLLVVNVAAGFWEGYESYRYIK